MVHDDSTLAAAKDGNGVTALHVLAHLSSSSNDVHEAGSWRRIKSCKLIIALGIYNLLHDDPSSCSKCTDKVCIRLSRINIRTLHSTSFFSVQNWYIISWFFAKFLFTALVLASIVTVFPIIISTVS